MADRTGISWTDATWNPVRGCSRVSEGCRNCYAERIAARFSDPGMPYYGIARRKLTIVNNEEYDPGNRREARWTGEVRMVPEHLSDPLRWKKPRRIFVNSMSDLFHEKLTNDRIAAVFGVMAACPWHTFQILTKRAKRMREWFAWIEEQREVDGDPWVTILREAIGYIDLDDHVKFGMPHPWPLPNVWLGASVENQEAANERLPELLATPAAVRFLSCEPLLGPLDLRGKDAGTSWSGGDWIRRYIHEEEREGAIVTMVSRPRVDWVIIGCESGPGSRPCNSAWIRSLRDQLQPAGVPMFLKQAVAEPPISPVMIGEAQFVGLGAGSKRKSGGVIELPYLDGVQHAQFPEVER